ncbi:MAG: hypothetical protein MI924_21925 [Chloroflexales bacterium]|nr:hypothetical protein [Chloroflexales bacterium]
MSKSKKQSYESNQDVQRWLRDQAEEHESAEVMFDPSFLASRRDSEWILSSLAVFYQQELISDVISEVSSGKEATVYCCIAHPSTGAEYLAAKVYRPRMFRSLKNDAVYRTGRTQRDVDGRVARDRRQGRSAKKPSRQARAARVSSWIAFEFETQQLLHQSGANVPRPVAHIGNAVLMEYIGDGPDPACLLHEADLTPPEAQSLFDCLIRNIELFLACDRIHGDLSAYNILYRPAEVTVIDFAQAVDPRANPEVFPLLERDVARICRYFARYGVAADPGALAADIWTRYMMDEL